jgi:hypothetical protein
MEASSQIRQASQNQLSEALTARVVTRAFGIRLGGFGVDYTSKQVTVDPGAQTGNTSQDTNGQAFETELSRERLRDQIFDTPWQEPSPEQQAASSHPDPAWRRGLQAYAKAKNMLLVDSARAKSTRLAVA